MKVESIGQNKTEITTSQYKILVSYATPVIALDYDKQVFYKTNKFWSVTTSRHINQWLNDNRIGCMGNYPIKDVEQSFLDDILD